MSLVKVLIVEDEILIADNIKRFLTRKGYEVVGIAISFEEAKEMYTGLSPDIALIDIHLHGPKTGIDFAEFIRSQVIVKPFIYLTSQFDSANVIKAKKTLPSAYLSKPIHKESLPIAIDLAILKEIPDEKLI